MDEALDIDLPLRLLDWYRSVGVDAAVGDTAIDWIARGSAGPGAHFELPAAANSQSRDAGRMAPARIAPSRIAPAPTTPTPTTPTSAPRAEASVARPPRTAEARPEPAATPARPAITRTFAAPSPDAAVQAARVAAGGAASLDALRSALDAFDGCALKATAKSLCFYRGAAQADLMIVGEAPAREDDLAGQPFSGAAGDMLRKMLKAINLDADACHITNAVYWRPPGNRHPTPQELDVCQPFLERQVALVAPRVLVLLGVAAARQVMDVGDGIMRVRGKWRDVVVGGHAVRAMASLSPSYLIKSPLAKQDAWRDLLAIEAALKS